MDWKQLVLQLSLIALASNPKTKGLTPYVGPAITATEELIRKVPGESKEDRNRRKLDHAIELVKTGIDTANTLHPGSVDTDISDRLIASTLSTVVDAANLIHKNQLPA